MTTKTDGGQAFPRAGFSGPAGFGKPDYGMTLRDYFAAKAMQGYLANSWQAQELDATGDSSREQMAIVAEISYVMADAMLAARENKS